MSTILGFVQGALRRKQLMASLVEQFKQNHENTRCIDFRFNNAKVSQEKSFLQSITIPNYVQIAPRKKQLVASFV